MTGPASIEPEEAQHKRTVAIMQPYFLPYIGYFQLIREASIFVVYDNIKYTKKGWINRNRMLRNGEPAVFSLPLKNDSDLLDIRERFIAPDFDPNILLAKIRGAYQKAPYFEFFFPVLKEIFKFPSNNLFDFILNSIESIKDVLRIETPLVVSSSIDIDHSRTGQDRVLAICKDLRASTYLNPPGGRALYSEEAFRDQGMTLSFIAPHLMSYDQFGGHFVPSLSILDVLMFNPIERVLEHHLPAYDISSPNNA